MNLRKIQSILISFLLPSFVIYFYLPQASAQKTSFSKVYVQCAVAQGNGFNWASTLAWLSAVIHQQGMKALAYEMDTGKLAGVDVGCFTGSSSSAFVSLLLDRLLQNPSITSSRGASHKILNPDQAFSLSHALYLLSLSTDLSLQDLALLGLDALNTKKNEKANDHTVDINYWDPLASFSLASKVFNKWIRAADLYDKNWLTLDITDSNKSLYRKYRLESLTDYPGFGSRQDLARLSKNEASSLDGIMDETMSSQAAARIPKNLTEMENYTISPDFCVTAFAVTAQEIPLDLSQMSLIYICSPNTIANLRSSASLKKMLTESTTMKNRIILASTPYWQRALNLSVREPELFSEISGFLTSPPLNMTEAWKFNPSNKEFELYQQTQPILIMGGFADFRQQAWAATALLNQRLASLGAKAEGRIVYFGLPNYRNRPDANFAQKKIMKYFSNQTHPAALDALEDYFSWQDEYCHAYTSSAIQDFYFMNWNLDDRPAAATWKSYILTAKGWNLVQIQTNFAKHEGIIRRTISFDPVDNDYFIPPPPEKWHTL